MANPTGSPKMLQLVQGQILFSFVALKVLLFIFVVNPSLQSPAYPSRQDFPILAIIPFLCLVGSVIYTQQQLFVRFVTGSTEEVETTEKYQTKLLIALALCELPFLLAAFVILPYRPIAFTLMGASLLVDLFVILPAWLSYWNARKARGMDAD